MGRVIKQTIWNSVSAYLGVVLGDIVFILIAYFGSKSLLERIKDDPRLFFIGGLILLVYGIITYLDKSQKTVVDDETLVLPEKTNYLKLFLKGFLLNFINIGVLAFWLGWRTHRADFWLKNKQN